MMHVLRGSLAGLIATVPMSLVMRVSERLIPIHNKGHLPPRQITESMLSKLGVRHHLDRNERRAAASIAHYGFGATAGALLGELAARPSTIPKPVVGAVVGSLVWAASYMGWLPLANVRRSAAEEPLERNVQMILAHVVWGAVAGTLLDAMEEQGAFEDR
jgi:uncharacterized membrane protein YagU involved in acid resistance